MKAFSSFTLFVAIMFLAASALADDVRVKKEELPQPVLNTLEKLVPGNTFRSAEKSTEKDGTIMYKIGVAKPDRGIQVFISSDGKWTEMREGSAKLLENAPVPARKTIETASGGEPDTVQKLSHPEKNSFYRFRTTRSIAADGTVSDEENLGQMKVVKNDEVPQPIRTTIEKLAPGSDWFATQLIGERAKYPDAYQVRTKAAKFFIVSPDGKVLETWDLKTKFADVPAPVAKVIRQRTQGSNPHDLIKIVPAQGKTFYLFRIQEDIALDGSVMPKKEED